MKIRINDFRRDFKNRVSPIQGSIPRVHLYEMDLSTYASKQEEMVEDEDLYASFSKGCVLNTHRNGLRSPGFWTGFYQAMIGNNMELEGLALSNAVGSTDCIMQFLPGSCSNKAAGYIADIAQAQLGSTYDVKILNGDHTCNAKAEGEALDAVEVARKVGRKVWFISSGMAQRSFSVPAIDTVLLTYDGGDLGTTLQKLSRALTAGDGKELGNVVSISVDPNRVDKVSSIVLSSAQKAAEQNGTDVKDELRRAYATFPLFSIDETGNPFQVKEDDYIERAMSLDSSIPLAVNRSVLYTISDDNALALVEQILTNMSRSNRAGDKASQVKGKRFIDAQRRGEKADTDDHQAAVSLLATQLDAFVHNLDIIRYWVPSTQPQLSDILNEADRAPEKFVEAVGVTPQFVRDAVDAKLLRRPWIDTILLTVA